MDQEVAWCPCGQCSPPSEASGFVQKTNKESSPLREGIIDVDIGVVGKGAGPELRTQGLFCDRFVGVVRAGHGLASGEVTAARFAQGEHIIVSRRGVASGPVDEAPEALRLTRSMGAMVDGFGAALSLARASDLIASVPAQHTGILRAGMHTFTLPFEIPEITVCLLWHPRMDADPAHRWLRGLIREVCAA